jgi:uncharacterized repeat protein (TIGR01451 family)
MRYWWFLLILVLIPAASAQGELIEKNWFRTGDSIIVDNLELTVYVSEVDEVLLQFDSKYKTLQLDDCTVFEDIRVCFEDIEDGDDRRAWLEIFRIEPTLKIIRTFDKTRFFIGEDALVSVTIENTGLEDAENIQYEDVFPEGIEIVDTDSPAYDVNNTVFWEGDLASGQKRSFDFEIQAVKEINVYQRAELKHNGESQFSKRIRLRSKSCFEFVSYLNVTNTSIGNKIGFDLTLYNRYNEEDEDIDIDLTLELPQGLDVTGIDKVGPVYKWITTLGKDDNDTKDIEIIPRFSFDLEFPIKIQAECSDVTYTEDYSEFIEIQKPKLVFRTNIDDINQTDEDEHDLDKDAGQTERMIIRIQKPNKNLYFKDIYVTATTNLEFDNSRKNISKYIERLDREDNVDIIHTELKTPEISKKKKFFMNLSAAYTTSYGQTFKTSKLYEITVYPVETLKITHEFGESEIEEGEENNITVKLKNTRSVDLDRVFVQDFLIFNNTKTLQKSRTIDIEEGDTRTVYEYKVLASGVERDTKMTIETVVQYQYEGNSYSFSKQNSFGVIPKELDLEVIPKISGDSYLGQPFNLEYGVKNEEESEPIYNITLQFPIQPEFDLIGAETYFIEKLNPNEEVKVINAGKLRPKYQGQIEIQEFAIFYHDEHGNQFNTTSETEREKVEPGYFIGPAVFVEKKLSKKEANQTEIITVYIDVENKGESKTSVQVIDDLKKWDITLLPDQKIQISRLLVFEEPGRQVIKPAIIKYQGIDETYTTASNKLSIQIKETIVEGELEPVPILVLAEQKIRLHPFVSLVALALAVLIAVVGYLFIRETYIIKRPVQYSEKEKIWKRY